MGKPCELKNTPQGHAPLSNRLRKAKVSCVRLKATGHITSPSPWMTLGWPTW